MTIVVDVEKAKELLKWAVDTAGEDFIYLDENGLPNGTCRYWHTTTDAPGCIIGHILTNVGVVPDSLIDLDGLTDGTSAADLFFRELKTSTGDDVKVTEEASGLFLKAQSRQDSGVTWGEAVRAALESNG